MGVVVHDFFMTCPADNQLVDCTPFVWLSTVHGNELHMFLGQGIPPILTIMLQN